MMSKHIGAKYTMRLKDAYELEQLNIWDSIENPVLTQFDAFVIAFDRRYYLYEIGFDTWGEFKHYVIDKYLTIENKYNNLLSLYDKALATDPLIDNKGKVTSLVKNTLISKNVNRFADTPNVAVANPLDSHLTNMSDSNIDNIGETDSDYITEGFTTQEIQLADNYVKLYRDILDEMVKEFVNCFMSVL